MKKLTTSSGVFGPYAFIETLDDRYRCDGADLPFSVIGTGEISDWTDPIPQPALPLPSLEDYDRALTAHLDAVAKSRRWQDRISLMARAGFPGPWQADAIAFGQWADMCNSIGYAILADFQAGNIPQPTVQEVLDALPEMVWP